MNMQQSLHPLKLPASPPLLAGGVWAMGLLLPVLLFVVSGCIPITAEEATPAPTQAPQTVPVLALAPPSARPGTTVFLSSAGWQPNEVLTLNLVSLQAGEPMTTTIFTEAADEPGSSIPSFLLPADLDQSDEPTVTVVVTSNTSGASASSPFLLAIATAMPTAMPTVQTTNTAVATETATAVATSHPNPGAYGISCPTSNATTNFRLPCHQCRAEFAHWTSGNLCGHSGLISRNRRDRAWPQCQRGLALRPAQQWRRRLAGDAFHRFQWRRAGCSDAGPCPPHHPQPLPHPHQSLPTGGASTIIMMRCSTRPSLSAMIQELTLPGAKAHRGQAFPTMNFRRAGPGHSPSLKEPIASTRLATMAYGFGLMVI